MHWTQLQTPQESQNKKVLAHLIKYGGITAEQAVRLYRIYRLSGRIYDLRRSGHSIESKLEFQQNDKRVHWAKYSLKK